MRKLMTAALIAATMIPASAMARDDGWRDASRDVREERREYRDALRYGDRDDIREERREYQRAVHEYRRDRGETRYDRGYRWRHHGVHIGRPYAYGLPSPPRYGRWVREGRDVVLIDVRSYRVLDVRYNRFR